MRVVDAVAPVNPGAHDLVSRVRSRRRAVGDIDARSRAQVVAGARHAVLDTAEVGAVELHREARVNREPDVLWLGPAFAAVEGLDQDVRALPGHADCKLVREDVDDAVAVSSHRATGAAEALLHVERVIARGRDLVHCPSVASVPRGRYCERLRRAVPVAQAPERCPA